MLEGMSEHGERPSLESRVAALEWEVRQLRAELIRTQAGGDRPSIASRTAPVPPVVEARLDTTEAPRPWAIPGSRAEPRTSSVAMATPLLDLETLVGRYGMLGLATLLALAAIGTFVSWAMAHGLLGPTTRVALGLVAAAAIAAGALKPRARSRSFSD